MDSNPLQRKKEIDCGVLGGTGVIKGIAGKDNRDSS
jgi:hypothetical protein